MTDESVTRSFGLLVKMGLTCGVSNWGICWPGVSPLVQVPGSFRPFLTYFLYMYFLHCFIPNILDPDWCIVALKVVRFNSRLKSHPFSVISQPSILFIIVTILMLWMCHESQKHSTFGVFFFKATYNRLPSQRKPPYSKFSYVFFHSNFSFFMLRLSLCFSPLL